MFDCDLFENKRSTSTTTESTIFFYLNNYLSMFATGYKIKALIMIKALMSG